MAFRHPHPLQSIYDKWAFRRDEERSHPTPPRRRLTALKRIVFCTLPPKLEGNSELPGLRCSMSHVVDRIRAIFSGMLYNHHGLVNYFFPHAKLNSAWRSSAFYDHDADRNLTSTAGSFKKAFMQPQRLLAPFGDYTQWDGFIGDANYGCDQPLYSLLIKTSNDYDSSILEPYAGVLLAIHGEHGSFLHTISPYSGNQLGSSDGGDHMDIQRQRFTRGATDVVSFSGPDIGVIEAIWISPEAGTWKMEEVSIMVFPKGMLMNCSSSDDIGGLQYNFVDKDILIGGDSFPAVELKASSTRQVLYTDSLFFATHSPPSEKINAAKREEGMEEYSKLKIALLGYDAMLVMLGTSMALGLGLGDIAVGFSVGGFAGVLYLWTLQRAVDELSAPHQSSMSNMLLPGSGKTEKKLPGTGVVMEDGLNVNILSGFKAPLTRFAGVIGISALFIQSIPNLHIVSMPKERLLAGLVGFLMSKVATILASQSTLFR